MESSGTTQGTAALEPEQENTHSGIILLAPPPPRRTLRAPRPPKLSHAQRSALAPTPDAIPFSGEYRFFNWPLQKPPASSMVARGTPIDFEFTSLDRFRLCMEAVQTFDPPLNIQRVRQLDVSISNADKGPRSVEVEMILYSEGTGVSLGRAEINTMAARALGVKNPVKERLSYRLPNGLTIQLADRIVIVFHLLWPRNRESAKLAVDEFYLR